VVVQFSTVASASTARVLTGPFNAKVGASEEVHLWSPAVTTFSVVLGVEQTSSIVSVGVGFTVSVVTTSRVMKVKVSVDQYNQS